MVRGGRDVFGLRVNGDSMIEAGIFSGDYIFVRKQITAQRGEIVVALIGDEATVKYYFPEKDYIRFQPANGKMAPILVRASDFRPTSSSAWSWASSASCRQRSLGAAGARSSGAQAPSTPATFPGVKPVLDRSRQDAFIEARRRVQKLTDAEVASHTDRAFSRDHWRELFPDLSVEHPAPRRPL